MPQPAGSFQLQIERVHDFEFRVRFDRPGVPDLVVEEPPPLGEEAGPNPARLLAAAVGSCLSASLAFCLKRAKIPIRDLTTDVSVDLELNDNKRLRVGRVSVLLHPVVDDPSGLAACLDTYEDFCVVTQSVREGLDVQVAVDVRPSATSSDRATAHVLPVITAS
jgi:organic hydroperoxide reductase OsmC/OhrA